MENPVVNAREIFLKMKKAGRHAQHVLLEKLQTMTGQNVTIALWE